MKSTKNKFGIRPFLTFGVYTLYLALLYISFDILVGLVLIDDDNCFKNHPLPPYGAVITAHQRKVFERLSVQNYQSYIVFDQHLGWTIGCNRTGKDGMYVSNSHGIRATREYSYEIPKGITRITVFGDSFAECVNVRNEQSWPFLLEKSSKHFEVLNFGVRAYGTDQAFLRYRRDGRKFQQHIVLIGFMLENIRRNVNRYRPTYEHNTGGLGVKPRFINTKEGLVLLPNPVSSTQELKRLITEGRLFEIVGPNDYWYEKFKIAFNQESFLFHSNILKTAWLGYEKYERNLKRIYNNVDGEPFIVTARILKKFYDEALHDGAEKALVLILPSENQIEYYLDHSNKYWQPLLNFFEQNQIPYIDVTDRLAAEHLKNSVIYGHYTPFGNEIVKSVIVDWFQAIQKL
ncbi:MAG: hypothetical protein ACE5JB_14415 [bacterium]